MSSDCDAVEFVTIDPWTDESLRGSNPLCKVPTLIAADGEAIYDSRVAGILGLTAFLLRIYARAKREAACMALVLVVLLSYPSMQFSARHFFHLEALFWLGLLSLVAAPFEWTLLRPHARSFAAWASALLALASMAYLGLVVVQDRV